jgi:putative ABC transport system permease protein
MERLDGLTQDLTLVGRALASHKAWTAIVMLTLALGIGANSALFTVVNAVLLRPLPYPQPDRIVVISEADPDGDSRQVADRTYLEWQRASRSFETIAAIDGIDGTRAIISGPDTRTPEVAAGQHVTATYFAVLAVRPILGRAFTSGEGATGAAPVIVLSEQLWRRRFSGDSTLLGRAVRVDGASATVVGVMPASFTTEHAAQYWVPLRVPAVPDPQSRFYYTVVGRLRRGATVASARDELTAIKRQATTGSGQLRYLPVVTTLHERLYGDARASLVFLFGAVGVVLVIACANIVNLLLVRAARRQREFAVRIALGASRWRLVRYLLCESLVLSLGGSLLGLLVPLFLVRSLVRMAPPTVANVEGISVDGTVLLFTLGVAVLTGLVVGVVPAMDAGRGSLTAMLSSGSERVTDSRRQSAVRRALIVTELATALILLTCAGLLTRSFARVLAIDPGFRPDRLLNVEVELPPDHARTDATRTLFAALVERARALPGVEAAALTDVLPLGGARRSYAFTVNGKQSPVIDLTVVTPEYFATIGARVVGGRALSPTDSRGAQRVAVVNRSLARALYGDANPIGEKLKVPGDSGRGAIVVGVLQDIARDGLEAGAHPAVYVPVAQSQPGSAMHLVLRTRGEPAGIAASVRTVVRELDPSLPAPRLTPMERVMATAVAPRRFSFVLLGTFAMLAALLAGIGLYGVITHLVADRTREIGIRIALGADPRRVARLVVAQGTRLLALGVGLGFLGSVGAVRLLRGMIFQVGIYDPWTFIASAVTLALVAWGASYIPARRATRIDALVALRDGA